MNLCETASPALNSPNEDGGGMVSIASLNLVCVV